MLFPYYKVLQKLTKSYRNSLYLCGWERISEVTRAVIDSISGKMLSFFKVEDEVYFLGSSGLF